MAAQWHILERLDLAQDTIKAAEWEGDIDYDGYEKRLNEMVKDLVAHVKNDMWDGYEDQGLSFRKSGSRLIGADVYDFQE